jgi:hypothetical protein
MPKDKDKDVIAAQQQECQYPQAESCPHYGTPPKYRPGDDPHPVM